ncbi:unnamed protein product, partial [Effrenium voratum]
MEASEPEALEAEAAWRRFDAALAALSDARSYGQAEAPGPELLAQLEALAQPFRGTCRFLVTNLGGAPVAELDFDVRRTVLELRREVAALTKVPLEDAGLVDIESKTPFGPEDHQALA